MEHRGFPESKSTAKIRKTTCAGAVISFRTKFHQQGALINEPSGPPFAARIIMKPFIGGLVAIGILWAIDVQFNGGRYSDVVRLAVKSALRL